MSDTTFEIDSQKEGDALVVTVQGELDLATAPALRERLSQAVEGGESSVVLDLSGLRFLDSTGLRVLIETHHRLAEGDGSLVLRGVADTTARVLEIAGLTEMFNIQ